MWTGGRGARLAKVGVFKRPESMRLCGAAEGRDAGVLDKSAMKLSALVEKVTVYAP